MNDSPVGLFLFDCYSLPCLEWTLDSVLSKFFDYWNKMKTGRELERARERALERENEILLKEHVSKVSVGTTFN